MSRKSIWPVISECWGVDVVVCLEQGVDCLHMAHYYAWQNSLTGILHMLEVLELLKYSTETVSGLWQL